MVKIMHINVVSMWLQQEMLRLINVDGNRLETPSYIKLFGLTYLQRLLYDDVDGIAVNSFLLNCVTPRIVIDSCEFSFCGISICAEPKIPFVICDLHDVCFLRRLSPMPYFYLCCYAKKI